MAKRTGSARPTTPQRIIRRDAGTGKIVSKEYADKHPKTTTTEKR